MKCTANKTTCVAFKNGECHTIENCMYQDYFVEIAKMRKEKGLDKDKKEDK